MILKARIEKAHFCDFYLKSQALEITVRGASS